MSRFLFLAALALFLVPVSASAFISCTTFGGVINCDDYSLPDVKPSQPIQVPNNTSGVDVLKAQYGTSAVYACMSDTDYLSHSGGPSSGVYFQLLKVCVERKASYGGDIQLQKVQTTPTCPAGTYAQNGVCIQTVIQQQIQAPAPVQDNTTICRTDYGPNSVWTGEWNDQGGPVCGCAQGYDWQGNVCAAAAQPQTYAAPETCAVGTTYDGSACVKNETRCRNAYGPGSTWDGITNNDGGPQCDCMTGYEWNEATTMCRAVIVQAPALVDGVAPEEPKSRGWLSKLLDWLIPW